MMAYLDSASERASVDEGPVVAILLLQCEPKSRTAGVSTEVCGFVEVKI